MNRLFMLAIGVAVGYVLGTKDGRERLDAVKAKVSELWEDPRVAKARKDVEDYARQQAPIIRERAEAAAKAAPAAVAEVAKDVADKVSTTAKDVAEKASATAKDVAEKVTDVAADVRTQAGKVAADLRDRGEAVIDGAVISAGQARDRALDILDDADDEDGKR